MSRFQHNANCCSIDTGEADAPQAAAADHADFSLGAIAAAWRIFPA
jgi:hypothetical protein